MRSDHQDLIRDDGSSGGNENGKQSKSGNKRICGSPLVAIYYSGFLPCDSIVTILTFDFVCTIYMLNKNAVVLYSLVFLCQRSPLNQKPFGNGQNETAAKTKIVNSCQRLDVYNSCIAQAQQLHDE